MSSGGKKGNARKRNRKPEKKQVQDMEFQDTNNSPQGPSLSSQKVVLRSWFKDDQRIEVECSQPACASPLSLELQKLSERMEKVALTDTDSDTDDDDPVSVASTHRTVSLQEEKPLQPQTVKNNAKKSNKKKSKNVKSQQMETQQQKLDNEEKTKASKDEQSQGPNSKGPKLKGPQLKGPKSKGPKLKGPNSKGPKLKENELETANSKIVNAKPLKDMEQTPISKEKTQAVKSNDVVPKMAKPKKKEQPQKNKETNPELLTSKVEANLPKVNEVEQTEHDKEMKQNMPNKSKSSNSKQPQVEKVESRTQKLKKEKPEKAKPKPKKLRSFTDEDLTFICKKLHAISLNPNTDSRKDKLNPKRKKDRMKEPGEKVDFYLSVYRVILERLSEGVDEWEDHDEGEEGCTCDSVLDKRIINPNLLFEESVPELSENLFQVDEDFETALMDAITMSVNNYHCGFCKKSNVDVYFKHISFNRIMVFKCLNCAKILGENPVTDTIYVTDMKTKERNKTCNTALHFARTVANAGFTYKEASVLLKLKNFPPVTETELHALIRDLHCYYYGKCEDQKVSASAAIRKHYKEHAVRPKSDGLLDLAVFIFQIKVPLNQHSVLMAGFVIEVETGIILDMANLEAYCRKCREFYTKKDKPSKMEIALWMATHGKECDITYKDGMKEEYHEIAMVLFGRSKKMGFRYATLIANNISPNLKRLQNSGIYGDANPINIVSYLNYTSQKIERELKLATKSKYLTGEGDGALTATMAKTFGGLYKSLFTKTSGDFSLMRKCIFGVVFHHASTDETPLHQLCHRDFYCSFPTAKEVSPKKGWHRSNLTFSVNKKSATTILTILAEKITDDVLQIATGEPPMFAENVIDYIVALVQKFKVMSVDMIGYAYCRAFLVHNQRLLKK